MPTVANLAVSVTARTVAFNRKMQDAGSTVRAFGAEVVEAGKRLVVFGSIAGGVVVGGLIAATKKAFTLIGTTGTLADRLGITTEQLVGFRHGLEQTGSTAATADRGLAEFVRRLGEASTRSGVARDAVHQLGLDEQALVAMGAADAMRTLADRVAMLPNRFEQAEAAFRLMGTRGREWINILRMGSRGIDKFMADARDLGIVFTELEAQQIRNANNALKRLWQIMRVTGLEIAKRLAPFVHWAAEELVQFATAGGGAGVRVTQAFALIAEAGGKLASGLALLESAWHGLSAVVLTVSSNMLTGFERVLDGLRRMLIDLASGTRAIATLLPIPKRVLDEMDEKIKSFQDGVERSRKAIAGLADSLASDAGEAIRKMDEAWDRFATGKAAEEFKAKLEEIVNKARELAKEMLRIRDLGPKRGLIPLEDIRKAKKARITEFQQISIARMAVQPVSTPSRPQIVSDPQLVETNRQLNAIRFALLGVRGVN